MPDKDPFEAEGFPSMLRQKEGETEPLEMQHGEVDNHVRGFLNGGFGLIQGLGLTLKNLFRPPVTLEYPDKRWELPTGFRGVPVLVTDEENEDGLTCVGCGACARACPPKVIHIETSKASEDSKKKLNCDEFSIDMTRCMVCNLCVESCPFDAITMSSHFEMGDFENEGLVYDKEELAKLYETTKTAMIKAGHSWKPIEGETEDWVKEEAYVGNTSEKGGTNADNKNNDKDKDEESARA